MAEKFDSTADVPYLARDVKTVGPGGGEDLQAEDVGTTVDIEQTNDAPNVEIIEDGSAVVGEQVDDIPLGFNSNLAEKLDASYMQGLSNELIEKVDLSLIHI